MTNAQRAMHPVAKNTAGWQFITGHGCCITALLVVSLLLSGCSHSPAPDTGAELSGGAATAVTDRLTSQLQQWHGTPYRYGGMSRQGIDCSGFVMLTFQQQFHTVLPRETRQQAQAGQRIARKHLRAGDLVFFKTGSGENGLHVGIYQGNNQFIHASTRRGVIRSSLDNPYWNQHFWQARRLPLAFGASR